jgi:hypothetical protein
VTSTTTSDPTSTETATTTTTTTTSTTSDSTDSSDETDEDPIVVHWQEDFESGFNGWTIEGNVWDIGKLADANGPSAHGGENVAGTALRGSYPAGTYETWLVSPALEIPNVDDPRLHFWDWIALASYDRVNMAVREVNGTWQNVYWSGWSTRSWQRHAVSLRPFVGKKIQVGLGISSADNVAESGWYVDDMSIESGSAAIENTSFEMGFGAWHQSGGVWAVGEPSDENGPKPHSGKALAGTVLNASYPGQWWGNAYQAQLYVPEFLVPSEATSPRLSYWQWHDLRANTIADGWLRVDGGAWMSLGNLAIGSSQGQWVQASIDLSAYKGHRVTVSFQLSASGAQPAAGWFIDDVEFILGE